MNKKELHRQLSDPQSEKFVTLRLIREELKACKLFGALSDVGLDDSDFRPYMNSIILRSMEIEHTDDTFNACVEITESRGSKIRLDQENLLEQTLGAYRDLLKLKKASQSSRKRKPRSATKRKRSGVRK